jgi:TDG/mug DNA glycosylase family protein
MRLRDKVEVPVRVLFVGINPGLRSAATGHHFAGYSNRFWKLLFDAGLVPEPIRAEDDGRLPEWGYGLTNVIARATSGIDELGRDEFDVGLRRLRRKVRRWQPRIVAFVGVTVFRAAFAHHTGPVTLGPQHERFEGARVYVLPNPSGRNANYSYGDMVRAFRGLRLGARG